MIDIIVKTIPHKNQRYRTPADYFEHDGVEEIRLSNTGDWRYEALLLFHELVEILLTKLHGVSEEEIMKFDTMFEVERKMGLHFDEDEPGWDKRAPYRREHRVAEWFERALAFFLKVKWRDYETAINDL